MHSKMCRQTGCGYRLNTEIKSNAYTPAGGKSKISSRAEGDGGKSSCQPISPVFLSEALGL